MTDNEIIKTLELEAIYCRGEGNMYGPTKKTFVDAELIEGALALINRQKAEIEKQEAEIERLNYILQCYALEYGTVGDKERLLKVARAEAVKEFAERLEHLKKFRSCMTTSEYELSVTMREIDNLAKELIRGKADEDK